MNRQHFYVDAPYLTAYAQHLTVHANSGYTGYVVI